MSDAAPKVLVRSRAGLLGAAWDALVERLPLPSPFLRSWWLRTTTGPRAPGAAVLDVEVRRRRRARRGHEHELRSPEDLAVASYQLRLEVVEGVVDQLLVGQELLTSPAGHVRHGEGDGVIRP
jgi:hypothetical protein